MDMQISPSLLAADFARLADEAATVADAADWLHIDVMDGHFVPNLTVGLPVVMAMRKHTGLPLDWKPDRLAIGDGAFLRCSHHGAVFRVDDGVCVAGPCLGESLLGVILRVVDGVVFLAPEDGPACSA